MIGTEGFETDIHKGATEPAFPEGEQLAGCAS